MLKHLLLALLAVVLFAEAFDYNRREIDSAPLEMPEVADQLVMRIKPGTISARKPNIAWYLNQHFTHYPMFKWVVLPHPDPINEIRRQGIDYIYLSPNEWFLRPELRPLWNPRNAPPDFKVVYERPAMKIIVYQVMHPAASASQMVDPNVPLATH